MQLGLAGACIALVSLAACTSGAHRCPSPEADCAGRKPRPAASSTRPPQDRRGAIDFGFVGSPATLDPYSPQASELTYELAAPVYPSLFRFDPGGLAHPSLADRLVRFPGGVRVKLQRARWSDGHRVSAADVVRSWRRARPPSGFARIDSVRARGRGEVELRGNIRRWKQALATLSYVLPGGRARRLSAGPYRVRSYTPGLRLVLERNPHWWGSPVLDTVRVDFVQSLQVLLLLLREGRIDAGAPPSSVNLDSRLDAIGIDHSDALGWESVDLVFPGGALGRTERRSLGAGVARIRLAQGFIRGQGRASTTTHPGPGPRSARGPWRRRWPAGPEVDGRVTLSAPAGDELLELLQRALQLELAPRFRIELATIDPQTFYGRWHLHNPTQIALVRSSGAPGLGRGQAAYRQARALPLFEVETVVAWRAGLQGLRANPTFDGPLWNLARWTQAAP